MRLKKPRFVPWLVAVVSGSIAILMRLGILRIPFLSPFSFWLLAFAFVLLLLATLIKNL